MKENVKLNKGTEFDYSQNSPQALNVIDAIIKLKLITNL